MAIRGRVASFALVGRKITSSNTHSSIAIVMLIGSSARQEG